MFVLTALWQLFIRIFLGIAFVSLLIGVAFIFIGNKGPNSKTHRSGKCTYVNSAKITRVVVENRTPWDENTKGFCAGHLEGQPDPEIIILEKNALKGVASSLSLSSVDSIDKISFGTNGVGHWLKPDPIQGTPEIPENMILINRQSEIDYWHFMQTAGWMPSGFRLSAMCVDFVEQNLKRCSVRLTRRSDGMVFEVWRMQVDKIPEANSRPPKQFLEVIDKLPKVIDLYQ